MTGLRGTTSLPQMWLWMVIAGIGIGPTLAAFTIVVQNAAPFAQLGAATGALTFFRQVGGTVGLAIAGTLFGSALATEIPVQMTKAGVPEQLVKQFGSSGAVSDLSGVGGLGAVLAKVPEQIRPMVTTGLHEAFSLAIASALWVSVAAAVVALLVTAVGLPELPLRAHHGPARVGAPGAEGSEPTPISALE
jgi:hypothetical protein